MIAKVGKRSAEATWCREERQKILLLEVLIKWILKSRTKKEVPDTVDSDPNGDCRAGNGLDCNKQLWRTCCSAKFSLSLNNVGIGIFT